MIINYLFRKYKYNSINIDDITVTKDDFYFVNKYDTFLFDIDDTILDFEKAEKNALIRKSDIKSLK